MAAIPSMSGGAGGASGAITSTNSSGFNSSGWNVNFGAGNIDSGNSKIILYAALAVGAYFVWQQVRRKK